VQRVSGSGQPSHRVKAKGPWSAVSALGLFLLVASLWWGSSQRIAVLSMSAVLLVMVSIFYQRRSQGLGVLDGTLLGCAVWTLLSVVPLPSAFVEVLSPSGAAWWSRSASFFDQAKISWVTLALDPGAAWLEALKWTGYGAVAWLAALTTRERGLNAVLAVVFMVSVVLAFASLGMALLHGNLGWLIAGLDDPNQVHRSPLVNPNNLSGFLNLGGFCGVGLVVSRRPPISKSVLVLGVCLVFASSIWSGSRGGVAVLVLMLFVLSLWWFTRWVPGSGPEARRKWAPALMLIPGVLALAWLGATSALYRELLDDDLDKLQMIPHLWPTLADYWLTGTGRGGFESVSRLYLALGSNVVFRYVENFLMSWLVEWGLPFGALLIAGLAFVLRPQFLRIRRAAPAQATYLGVLAVVAQNLLDLGLELFSLTAAAVAVLAALIASRHSRDQLLAAEVAPTKRWLVGSAIALMWTVLIGAAVTGPDAYIARQVLSQRWSSAERRSDALQFLIPAIKHDVFRRPADPYPYMIGALAAQVSQKPMLRWAAAALERAPQSGRVNLLVALSLAQLGAHGQAVFHLVEAVRFDFTLAAQAGQIATGLGEDAAFFAKNVAQGEAGARVLLNIGVRGTGPEQRAERLILSERAVALAPNFVPALTRLAGAILEEVAATKQLCQASGSSACGSLTSALKGQLNRLGGVVERLAPFDPCETVQLKARIVALDKEPAAALAVLDACELCPRPGACLHTGVLLAQSADRETRGSWEDRFLAASCDDPQACGGSEYWVGQLSEHRGDWASARLHYARAAELAMKGEYWMTVARMAIKSGQLIDAEHAYRQGALLGVESPEIAAALTQMRQDSLRKLIAQ